jgi:hypothetical protein
METNTHRLRHWALTGSLFAGLFAIWMLFFPDLVKPHFAWDAHPRLTQAFIGAGYIFRTSLLIGTILERAWHRLRWVYWGNIVFTGTIVLATMWHIEDFGWFQPVSIVWAHIWLFIYIAEPIAMLYLMPPSTARTTHVPTPAGPILSGLRTFLIVEAGAMFTFGALLVINPEFLATRWPWSLVDNALDARIIAAWFLGWATWAGAMAYCRDWDEIRIGVLLNIVFGLALIGTFIAFGPLFDFSKRQTGAYVIVTVAFTALLLYYFWRQERARRAIGVPRTVEARGSAR